SLILGYRMGFNVDKNVAIGGQLDWRHQGNQENTVISCTPGPGGTTIDTETQVAKSSSDLIPILGVLQINIGNSGLIPYIGAGAGTAQGAGDSASRGSQDPSGRLRERTSCAQGCTGASARPHRPSRFRPAPSARVRSRALEAARAGTGRRDSRIAGGDLPRRH